MDNLYLEVKSDEYNEIIKLHFTEVESNDDFVYALNNNVSDDESSNVIDDDIPKYVRDNFKYDSDSKSYVYEHKDGDTSVVEKYSSETMLYDVIIKNDLEESFYSISLKNKKLLFRLNIDSKLKDTFIYDIESKKCQNLNCDKNYIAKFVDYYWKNLEIS